jgi:NADH:ubiquinone oxidoreductase subunit C
VTGSGTTDPTAGGAGATVGVDGWVEAVRAAKAEGFGYFDWLSAFDEGDGRTAVVVHLWHRGERRHRFVRTVVADGRLPTVAGEFAGAGWHEREAAEMFGLRFDGAPDTRPLLLADGFVGHPLRKDFPLTGYVEVRYDEERRQVIYEPVKLTQDYRRFDFISPWEGMTTLPGDEKAHREG